MKDRWGGSQCGSAAAATAEKFEASGLTRREFAARAGMSVWALVYWRARARRGNRMVEVELTLPVCWPGGSALTGAVGSGRRIEVGEGFRQRDLGAAAGAVIGGRFIGIEVKGTGGKQSDAQKDFQARLEAAGGLYLLVMSIDEVDRGYAGGEFEGSGGRHARMKKYPRWVNSILCKPTLSVGLMPGPECGTTSKVS